MEFACRSHPPDLASPHAHSCCAGDFIGLDDSGIVLDLTSTGQLRFSCDAESILEEDGGGVNAIVISLDGCVLDVLTGLPSV